MDLKMVKMFFSSLKIVSTTQFYGFLRRLQTLNAHFPIKFELGSLCKVLDLGYDEYWGTWPADTEEIVGIFIHDLILNPIIHVLEIIPQVLNDVAPSSHTLLLSAISVLVV